MESARGLIAESSEGPGVATPSYIYSPLSEDGNIRLLRLLPNQDYHAPIQCEIFEYPLRKLNRGPHLYEALSYVWGSEENQQPIWIQSNRRLSVTWNLHVALLHLRNPFFDRILWVDAICINQDPAEREKGHQVQMMADIYANANRVVVWLGEASADSDIAFDALKGAARGKFMKLDEEEDLEDVQKKAPGESLEERRAVFAVLERPWFQRIWVVQEVGVARRILMKCGSSELEGFVFCSGLSAMNLPYDTHPDLQALILPITNLIRDEIFRPPQDSGQQVASSLRTHTLAELVDLYHTRKAAKCVDKIYALLSISSDFSDNPEQSGLLVDYQASQDAVLESFTRLSLSPEMSVRVWDESGFAVIQGPGHILGRITEVKQGHSRDDVQNIVITWGKTALLSKRSGKDLTASRHQLQVTAKLVCEGDLVCLAKGGARPLIIRLFDNHAAIIRI
ncbi:heterokaryon incompatibility protein-domain-containing protein, partial [Immersiella caudata]